MTHTMLSIVIIDKLEPVAHTMLSHSCYRQAIPIETHGVSHGYNGQAGANERHKYAYCIPICHCSRLQPMSDTVYPLFDIVAGCNYYHS